MTLSIKTFVVFTTITFIVVNLTNAQSLQTTIDKIQGLGNVSFTEIVKFEFSFQDDFSLDTFSTSVSIKPEEKQIGGYYRIVGKHDTYLYDGTKAVWLNLIDSTYRITDEAVGSQYTRTILYWKKEIDKYLESPGKVNLLSDTIIDKIYCGRYLVSLKDSVQNGKHVFYKVNISVNKTNQLPFKIRSEFSGFADDGAYIGMYEEHTFLNYQFKCANFPDLSEAIVPQIFKLPVKKERVPMLNAGVAGPDIKLSDLAGKDFKLESLRGKVVLLNFTTDGCPHCINAAQTLARLYDEFKRKGFEIVSVYRSDFNSIASVSKFDARNEVKYPSYMTDNAATNAYHINGYPNFYLLDQKGIVVKAYEGYYAELEKEIKSELKKLIKQ